MDGIYEISMNTPMGKMGGKVSLKTNGENITGIILNIYAKTNMGEFKLQGKKIG